MAAIASQAAFASDAPGPRMEGYRLGAGDKVRVIVYEQEKLSGEYAVDASGRIAMPLIEPVGASGLTTDELAEAIADVLRQSLIRDPSIAVEVVAFRPFFILGEVRNPGQYPYVHGMSVTTAVAIAGGFTYRANKKSVEVTRLDARGAPVKTRAPIEAPLHPGDTVRVRERHF